MPSGVAAIAPVSSGATVGSGNSVREMRYWRPIRPASNSGNQTAWKEPDESWLALMAKYPDGGAEAGNSSQLSGSFGKASDSVRLSRSGTDESVNHR